MTGVGFAVYADEAGYYARGLIRDGVVCWRRDEDQWVASKGGVPSSAHQVEFAELPADLQEEVLAVAARSEVLGAQNWNNPN